MLILTTLQCPPKYIQDVKKSSEKTKYMLRALLYTMSSFEFQNGMQWSRDAIAMHCNVAMYAIVAMQCMQMNVL